MAKMFYTKEETLAKLGCTEAQLNKLIQDQKLQKMMDGPGRVVFRSEEVDKLAPVGTPDQGDAANEETDIREIPLAAMEDSSDEIDLSPMDMGSSIGLAPMDTGSSIGMPAMDTGTSLGMDFTGDSISDQISLEDTTQALDKDDTVLTVHGQDETVGDESEDTAEASKSGSSSLPLDPLMPAGIDLADHISLDSGSSGSGLLDLSREADDTSLGAELLEEIYPSADEGAVATQLPTQMDLSSQAAMSPDAAESGEPTLAEAIKVIQYHDPTSGVYGAVMIVPFLLLIYLAFSVSSAIFNLQPGVLGFLGGYNAYLTIGAAVLALALWAVGSLMITAKANPKTKKPKAAKEPKPKKEKKARKKK